MTDWAEQLRHDKWISQKEMDALVSFDTETPSGLFSSEERPLVVAFFGGTGVGKSSLLNRLAKENIARTGVERPTSREVTIYLHQSVSMDSLPEHFPTDSVKVALHRHEDNRDVMWIDMPDFDSTEQANKDMVLRWLPYIDVLLYVVNPERYKDDRGWRLLLEHGARHAWMFVINHWDRGVDEQREDFARLLGDAGLDDPRIFRTDCNPIQEDTVEDDFEALEASIQQLADDNIIRHLEERGINLRIRELQKKTTDMVASIGTENSIDTMASDWQTIWSQTGKDIRLAQQWPISRLSGRFATAESHWMGNVLSTFRGRESSQPESPSYNTISSEDLWDEQVSNLATDSLDKLVHRARLRGLASRPIQAGFEKLRSEHAALFSRNLQESLHEALTAPGTRWQRVIHRVIGYASTALPIAAMFWVAYKVVAGFYLGNVQGHDYLGFNFAVHSGLLIGLAWLLPWFAYQKTRPSRQQAAQTGMQLATERTLQEINAGVLEVFERIRKRQDKAIAGSRSLFTEDLLPSSYTRPHREKILQRLLTRLPNP